MTDKKNNFAKDINVPRKEQIINDGVDVSECKHLYSRSEDDGLINLCKTHPNCYYKQLQKEKFENLNNRQMVESAENLIYENSELYKNLKEKEQECEELKEQLELNTANAVVIDMAQRLYKLKQTLTEIKEIAEPFCNACQEFEPEKKGSNCMYCNYGKILQKISECEELKAYAQSQENQREEYYKEYLKLSQECEELKKEIAFENNGTLSDKIRAEVFKELNNENNQLKAENEELKGKLRKLELKNTTLQNRNQQLDGVTLEAIRYRKALEEIEEVLKDEICKECPGEEGCKGGCKEHQCLNIINKVKGEE